MFVSPENCPARWLTISVSAPSAGRTTCISPLTTTKNGTSGVPTSTSTSPPVSDRRRPCAAIRAICGGGSVGNTWSGGEPGPGMVGVRSGVFMVRDRIDWVPRPADRTGRLAEGERERLDTRVEELDLELTVGDWRPLPDQLIQPLRGHAAGALIVDVGAMRSARRLPIDQHPETGRRDARSRSHDEMEITSVKP